MTRDIAVMIARCYGWRPWGKLRDYEGSKYQCFRRRNNYLWIGFRFLERKDQPVACDFVADSDKEVFDFVRQP